ncbi:MAG TPA: hypothetical protein VF997_08115, partial [Polyangia bacterium]
MSRSLATYCAVASFCCALASSNVASAQFPERRAEEEALAPAEPAPAPAAPADTLPRPTPETVEDVVKRLMHMLLPSDLRLSLHGYFRAPLRLSIDRRTSTMPGEAAY